MGICKIEFKDDLLHVHVRRPGLLIGKYGSTLKGIEKYLDCGLHIYEFDPFKEKNCV